MAERASSTSSRGLEPPQSHPPGDRRAHHRSLGGTKQLSIDREGGHEGTLYRRELSTPLSLTPPGRVPTPRMTHAQPCPISGKRATYLRKGWSSVVSQMDPGHRDATLGNPRPQRHR